MSERDEELEREEERERIALAKGEMAVRNFEWCIQVIAFLKTLENEPEAEYLLKRFEEIHPSKAYGL